MTDLVRILVPVDFSPRSAAAVRYAAAMAAGFQAQLVLLHVIEPLHFGYSMVQPSRHWLEEVRAARRNEARAQLARLVTEAGVVPAAALVAEGEAADQILAEAHHQGASLIVMPTQGRSRLREFLIGSVTAKVLHDAVVPVCTGVHLDRGAEFPEFRPRQLLCAVDFGRQSGCVLGWGAELVHRFGARLHLVHVAEAAGAGAARERLARLVRTAGVDAEVEVASGEPHKEVAAMAGRVGADVVIIGRGSNTGAMGRLRAQAYGIVRQSPCPVLSV